MPTLLFVDDEPTLRRVVRTLLPGYGFGVKTASTMRSAKRCFAHYRIDGAFIDVWLGAESGFELYAWIQEHYPVVAKRVAFVTGEAEPGRAGAGTSSALDCPVIIKPFQIDDLVRQARLWFGVEKRGSGAGRDVSPPP